MGLNISPIQKLALIDIIIDQIGKAIAEGILKPGNVLPGERELSKMLNVSRTSVRQALKALDVLGVLEIKHGSPTYLRDSSWEMLVNPIKFMVLLHDIEEEQLLEERKLVEVELTKIATLKISDDEIKQLELNIEELKNCLNDKDKFINLDIGFHNTIINASGLKILPAMMLSINNLLRSTRAQKKVNKEGLQHCLEDHIKILNSIKDKNPEEAGKSMASHIGK